MTELASVKKVCVIGAGTMGSGIAAHLANLGFEVSLLDASQQSATEAFERAKVAKPPIFYQSDTALGIRLGNTAENLEWLSEADWVCEAIVERAGAKRALYARIAPAIRPDAYISTNTSGLEIGRLVDGLPDSFRGRLVGTHFFNPPRYLKLLELIPTPETPTDLIHSMTQFLEEKVARRVVVAKDTPGFIANRYGMWCMFHAIHVAEKLHLSVEQVDAITGPFLGRPKTASFRLSDRVGLDVMKDIAENLLERCPNDPYIQALRTPRSMATLIDKNWIGDKAGQGYYRREGKELLVLDLSTLAYKQAGSVDLVATQQLAHLPLPERIRQALDLKCETGEFLRHYLLPALKYADHLKKEISHSVLDVDRVMEWGFGWQMGPFATIDAIGAEKLGAAPVKYYEAGSVRSFEGTYHQLPKEERFLELQNCAVVSETETYKIRDLGDGVKAVSTTTKMGVITPALVKDLTQLMSSDKLDRFVLTSESTSFSVGYDLRFFSQSIADERWIEIDQALIDLQKLGELFEKHTVVTALTGYTLGAGLEIALSTSRIVAPVESHIGLPEAKVGLLPGGRGMTLMRTYNQGMAKHLSEVTFRLATGFVAGNAVEARTAGYLRAGDMVVFHPDRVLYEAKRSVLEAKPVERPTIKPTSGPLSGMIDRLLEVGTSKGDLSDYDETIGQKMKLIISKATTYEDCLQKERTEFLDLCSRALTHARINHMLVNGAPLRN